MTLEKEVREDDAQERIAALGMIRGVLSVKPLVDEVQDLMARERIRAEFREKVWKLLDDIEKAK